MESNLREYNTNTLVFGFQRTFLGRSMLNTYVVKLVVGYLFRTFSPYCTPQALNYLYRAQVLPLLDYGSIVWDPPT